MNTSPIWHYTIAATLLEIAESKVLRRATAGLPKRVKPATWFSTNPLWEETATPMYLDRSGRLVTLPSFKALVAFSITDPIWTPARVVVPAAVAPHRWRDYKRFSRADGRFLKGLYDVAITEGARPGEWRCSFYDVPESDWLGTELYLDGVWVPRAIEDLRQYRDGDPAL